MTQHLYAPRYRPPGYATVPPGFELVERGTGGHFPLRSDLPVGNHRFGLIAYRERLTDDERKSFELEYINTRPDGLMDCRQDHRHPSEQLSTT